MAALQPLVHHKNQSAMPTVAVSISSLKEFFSGVDDPEVIKRGILYAYENHDTRYIMLVGDAHKFPVRHVFYHCNAHTYNDGVKVPSDGCYIASDLYYSNLYHHTGNYPRVVPERFDNWDDNGNGLYNEGWWELTTDPDRVNRPNPDNVDGYPDVAVGRVPAHNVADVIAYVNKIISYESSAARYQTRRGRKFTFVADAKYDNGAATPGLLSGSALLNSPFVSADFLMIEHDNNPPPQNWWTNASPTDVATSASQSDWVSYDGHGGEHVWGYNGVFGEGDVSQTANSNALPVVFAAGCSTGQFSAITPWDGEYVDVNDTHHSFQPGDPPLIIDMMSGQSVQIGSSAKCPESPYIMPKPNVYDFDRPNLCFAYSWLIANAPGGAMAYFGEIGIANDWMAVELETKVLATYGNEFNPILGDIYLKAQRKYWGDHHKDPEGGPSPPASQDYQSLPRFFLGWMVFFGDPSLRLPRILDPCQSLKIEVENLQDVLSSGEILPKDRPAIEAYLRKLRGQLLACLRKFPKD